MEYRGGQGAAARAQQTRDVQSGIGRLRAADDHGGDGTEVAAGRGERAQRRGLLAQVTGGCERDGRPDPQLGRVRRGLRGRPQRGVTADRVPGEGDRAEVQRRREGVRRSDHVEHRVRLRDPDQIGMDSRRAEPLVVGAHDGESRSQPAPQQRSLIASEHIGARRGAAVREPDRRVPPGDHRPATARGSALRDRHRARHRGRPSVDADRPIQQQFVDGGARQHGRPGQRARPDQRAMPSRRQRARRGVETHTRRPAAHGRRSRRHRDQRHRDNSQKEQQTADLRSILPVKTWIPPAVCPVPRRQRPNVPLIDATGTVRRAVSIDAPVRRETEGPGPSAVAACDVAWGDRRRDRLPRRSRPDP